MFLNGAAQGAGAKGSIPASVGNVVFRFFGNFEFDVLCGESGVELLNLYAYNLSNDGELKAVEDDGFINAVYKLGSQIL